jgi:hypothetical protein
MSRRSSRTFVVIVILLLALLVLFLLSRRAREASPAASGPHHAASWEAGPKPEPKEISFHGCPPEGDGNDPGVNLLKNRVDEGEYIPVPFDTIVGLSWPHGIERRRRASWSDEDRKSVALHEGIPIRLEGYLAGVKEEGKESPNCHVEGHAFRDFHLWLVPGPDDDRSKSVVVEVTPRVRETHPNWTLNRIRSIVRNHDRVEIGGWLMLDPEHPDQVGATRGTIWEIHPVMMIRVEENGVWRTEE